jgi:DNA-binding NarL/FixJ family response regulator
MKKGIKTYLFCFDDHRGFAEDVRKRFDDTSRYIVKSFQAKEEFLTNLAMEREHSFCKIAILSLHDTKENYEVIGNLTMEIKNIDPRTGIILLGPVEKMEEIKKIIEFNIDAYIPKNANSILRIHNTVKKLISEHSILVFKRRRNISFFILIAFLILSVLFTIYAFFRLPQYF